MEKRSRSKTGFRFILAVPWLILGDFLLITETLPPISEQEPATSA